jgi:hypothetical protein
VAEFERIADVVSLPLRIDLTHLVFADTDGVRALRAQDGRGAQLVNVSPFMILLLDRGALGDEEHAAQPTGAPPRS